MTKKKKAWYPKSMSGKRFQKIADWLNCWGNYNENQLKTKEFRTGYNQAISDVFDKFGFDYKLIPTK